MLSNDEANIKTVPTDQLSRVYMKVLIGAGIQCITLIIKNKFSQFSQYVNYNKHPVPVPPSSRLIHYEIQHSCVTSCRKS